MPEHPEGAQESSPGREAWVRVREDIERRRRGTRLFYLISKI